MPLQEISLSTARALILQAQGLLHAPNSQATKETVLAAIQNLGVLQIDTINIVARSPYLSLFSRMGDYDPAWLDALLAEGKLFEYWAHAASFLPMEQYSYHRRLMLEKLRWHRYQAWYLDHQADSDAVFAHVKANGSVKSADFERKDGKKGTWWDWKIEKDALEYWFAAGELMITRREKFQRVYDLREQVLPTWEDTLAPSLDESICYLVLKTVQALGLSRPVWVADYFRLPKNMVKAALKQLLESGALQEVKVESWEEPALLPAETAAQINSNPAELEATYTTLLSPFDSLIWDRQRTRQIFGFNFSIECYLPAAKRKYGYYLLPVLYHGALVARLDAKAHRKAGMFEVKALYWEPGINIEDQMLSEVGRAIQACANWHRTPQVIVQKCEPDRWSPVIINSTLEYRI